MPGLVEIALIRNRDPAVGKGSEKRKFAVRAIQPSAKPSKPNPMPRLGQALSKAKSTGAFVVSRVEAERIAFHQPIDRCISEIAPKHKRAYSEIKRLEALKRHPLATRIVATLTSSDFARYRDERLRIRKGNTVKPELALFQCVIEVARREWGIHLAENLVMMVSCPSYNDERSRRLFPIEAIHARRVRSS